MRSKKQVLTNLALLVATLLALLVVGELTLRLSGFSYVLYPQDIEFGNPDPQLLRDAFVEDDDLFWVTPDYGDKLARLRQQRPRIVFMGDSCTQLGDYDRRLLQRLAASHGEVVSAGNLGVAGWSSYQGLRQLERDVLSLAPAVVTVYYGWNDHWIGFGIEDKNVARIKRIFSSTWSRFRWVQLVTKAMVVTASRETDFPNRVSLVDFADNLRSMVQLARQAGIRPVLLTAPSFHHVGEEPAGLARRWLRELSDLIPLHSSYIAAVRRVATEEESVLCDLAADFAALSPRENAGYFMGDGIHLSDSGNQRLADFLYVCFERHGILGALIDG